MVINFIGKTRILKKYEKKTTGKFSNFVKQRIIENEENIIVYIFTLHSYSYVWTNGFARFCVCKHIFWH